MKKGKLFILIAIIMILVLLLVGFLFIRKNNKTTENTIVESIDAENLEQLNYRFFERVTIPYDDMVYFNNIYYKQINSLDDYNAYKSKVSSLPECETNFDKNFIIIIMTENISTEYFVPHKIYGENNTLYVGLIKDASINPDSNAIILEIPKSLEKENIEPYKAIDEDIPYINYKPIKELPENYTAEEAKNDNCYVTQDGGIVFNKQLAEEFINNYNTSKDAFIRIVQFSDNGEFITDVYYSSGENKFLVCRDVTRARENFTYNYYKYSNLNKETLNVGKDGSTYVYTLTDPNEGDMTLLYI